VSQPTKTFKVVAGVHIGVIVVAFFHSGVVHLFEPKPEITHPIEFVVDVTPPMPDVGEVLPDIPEPEFTPPAPIPEPIPTPIPEPIPVPAPAPKPPPKRKPRPPIKVSRTKVRRSGAPKRPKQKQLSEAEIQKLLAEGATAGDYTSIPDEDSRCLAQIQKTLYAAWVQPSSEAAGGAVALLSVAFEPGGRDGRDEDHREQ
jgi:outer membrane biosynthesis protein TonB